MEAEERFDKVLDVINVQVIPKWKKYMETKSARRDSVSKDNPRNSTIWKKVMRDVREFYRILFRTRFESVYPESSEHALGLMKEMFNELGFTLTDEELNDERLYEYVHQTHQLTKLRMFKSHSFKRLSTPFNVIESYNEFSLFEFMEDPLASRMLYFVLVNFLKHYVMLISKHYRAQLTTLI